MTHENSWNLIGGTQNIPSTEICGDMNLANHLGKSRKCNMDTHASHMKGNHGNLLTVDAWVYEI